MGGFGCRKKCDCCCGECFEEQKREIIMTEMVVYGIDILYQIGDNMFYILQERGHAQIMSRSKEERGSDQE